MKEKIGTALKTPKTTARRSTKLGGGFLPPPNLRPARATAPQGGIGEDKQDTKQSRRE